MNIHCSWELVFKLKTVLFWDCWLVWPHHDNCIYTYETASIQWRGLHISLVLKFKFLMSNNLSLYTSIYTMCIYYPYLKCLVDTSSMLYQYIHYITMSLLTSDEERRCTILEWANVHCVYMHDDCYTLWLHKMFTAEHFWRAGTNPPRVSSMDSTMHLGWFNFTIDIGLWMITIHDHRSMVVNSLTHSSSKQLFN